MKESPRREEILKNSSTFNRRKRVYFRAWILGQMSTGVSWHHSKSALTDQLRDLLSKCVGSCAFALVINTILTRSTVNPRFSGTIDMGHTTSQCIVDDFSYVFQFVAKQKEKTSDTFLDFVVVVGGGAEWVKLDIAPDNTIRHPLGVQ